ncbi:MAG: DUF429 domain-containing protein, partial [Nocardioides sp.]
VADATRKSQLRVAEDQVDAVVCAYVAAYVANRPADVTVYGDLVQGYIVTPTLRPDAHGATEVDRVDAAIAAYAERRPGLVAIGEAFTRRVTTLLDDAGINYLTVTGRTKAIDSFAAKARRAAMGYADPLTEITDQVGVRVITYVLSDVSAVAELLTDELRLISDRDMGRETAEQGRFGYASRHLLIDLGGPAPGQVQIRTVLQHAWAEFEHDIRYKGKVPVEQAPDLDRRFTLAAGLLELADGEFSTIRDRLQAGMRAERPDEEPDADPGISTGELASFLAGRYAEAGWSRTERYDWINGLLIELGVTSLRDLRALLQAVDESRIATAMAYRYPPGAVRRLDDALLAGFGTAYADLDGNSERRELLLTRLDKIGLPHVEADPPPGEG